ncbi:HAD family hydrolase [Bacillus sp. T3]|uniref:HAD family hydrolase n=1 Tax=Bacillus sp. T3 TaxID=467262 RepID=UPI002980AD9B|nr:HAD family hydrolase [Bacillus sp. T3]
MKDYQILFLDIDGTILRPDHTIEDTTIKAINEMKEKDIHVVLSTGRPLHELTEISAELNVDSFIAYNGSYAIYKGKEIFKKYMDDSILSHYLEIAEENQHDFILYSNSHNLSTNLNSQKSMDFYTKFALTKNKQFLPEHLSHILSATVLTNDQNEQALYPEYEGIFFSPVNVNGMQNCFDILMDDINKGVAVQSMLSYLDIPREHAIAFGDGLNDKEMLSYVGEGFAMGNAHPALFEYAKHKTTDVHNSGIYNGLKKLGLLI